jgi:hypothetical protein
MRYDEFVKIRVKDGICEDSSENVFYVKEIYTEQVEILALCFFLIINLLKPTL